MKMLTLLKHSWKRLVETPAPSAAPSKRPAKAKNPSIAVPNEVPPLAAIANPSPVISPSSQPEVGDVQSIEVSSQKTQADTSRGGRRKSMGKRTYTTRRHVYKGKEPKVAPVEDTVSPTTTDLEDGPGGRYLKSLFNY